MWVTTSNYWSITKITMKYKEAKCLNTLKIILSWLWKPHISCTMWKIHFYISDLSFSQNEMRLMNINKHPFFILFSRIVTQKETLYSSCPLHFHGCLESGLPIYRQQHEEKGTILHNRFFFFGYIWLGCIGV